MQPTRPAVSDLVGSASALFLVFVALTFQVLHAGVLTRADPTVAAWFVAHRTPTRTDVAEFVTTLGSPTVIAAASVLAAVIVSRLMHAALPAVGVLAAVAVAGTASTILKVLIPRARPPADEHLVLELDHSFPSGHVTGTTALLVSLFLLVPPTKRRLRAVAAVAMVVLPVLVAASRLYLGVHWFTDVLGGAALGATTALAAAAVVTWKRAGSAPRALTGAGGSRP